jgi:hypothetical protein
VVRSEVLRALAAEGSITLDPDRFPDEYVPGNPLIARLPGDERPWSGWEEWIVDDLDLLEDEEDYPTCPVCAGPGVPLGTLGRRAWYRCRNCGTDSSFTDNGDTEDVPDGVELR